MKLMLVLFTCPLESRLHTGLLQYDREKLIELNSSDLPSPLSEEAAKMVSLSVLVCMVLLTNKFTFPCVDWHCLMLDLVFMFSSLFLTS